MRMGRIAWFVLTCAMAAVSARAQTTQPAPGPTTRPSTDALIRMLGDPRFAVRQEATAQLSNTPFEQLPDLARWFRQERRYDAKLRLRYAIENVFYKKFMSGQTGFLGITPWPLPGVYDPKTGQTVECMVADRVIEGNPAFLGGMKAKDILLDFGDQSLAQMMNTPVPKPVRNQAPERAQGIQPLAPMSIPSIDSFTALVKRRQPGTHVTVRVLRPGDSRRVNVTVGDKPEAMLAGDVLTPTYLGGDRYASIGNMINGLAIKQVPADSWLKQSGLKAGDVIVGIGNQPIQTGAPLIVLGEIFKRLGPRGQLPLEVRAVEEVKLDITIGARAPSLMNREDWEDAQAEFAVWWREQMGEQSLRFRPYSYLSMLIGPATETSDAEVVP